MSGVAVSVFTVREIADRLRVDRHKILGWIKSGELAARNLASKSSTRPVYRIAADDLAAFLDSRASTPAQPQPKRRPRRESFTEYV